MNLVTNPLQMYEKHQNIAGWVQQTLPVTSSDSSDTADELTDDSVSISQQQKIFHWIAQFLPEETPALADSGPINQQLFDYGLLSFEHQALLNRLTELKPDQSVINGIQEALAESTSYQQTQQLQHIDRIFQTLTAAQQSL